MKMSALISISDRASQIKLFDAIEILLDLVVFYLVLRLILECNQF
jgi:hypothetical protein